MNLFYIQDSRSSVGNNVLWWAKHGNSYTTNLAEAEVFTKEEAVRQHESRITDIPWPKAYVDGKARPVVDMQYLRKSEVLGAVGPFYLQDNRDFDGNDMFWLTGSGVACATNLTRAAAFNQDEVGQRTQLCVNYVAWPTAYVDAKSRPAVEMHRIRRDEALAGTGVVLRNPPKPKKEQFRCHGCGQFMSIHQYYGGECSFCGVDNRP